MVINGQLVNSSAYLVWEQYLERVAMGKECEKIAQEFEKYGVSATQWNGLAQVIAEKKPDDWTEYIENAATRLNSKWKDHKAEITEIINSILSGVHDCWKFRVWDSFRGQLRELGVQNLGNGEEEVPFPSDDIKITGARIILTAAIRTLLKKQVRI